MLLPELAKEKLLKTLQGKTQPEKSISVITE